MKRHFGYRVSNWVLAEPLASSLWCLAFIAVCAGPDDIANIVSGIALLVMLVPLTKHHKAHENTHHDVTDSRYH